MQSPTVATSTETLLALLHDNEALVEPVVFVLGLAESTVFVSLLVPSTVLFIGIGAAHSAVGGVFVPVWLAGTAGAFIGDMGSYVLGRYFKRSVTHIWPLNRNRRWVAYARLTVSRYGLIGVIASKFLGMARPFVPVIAGSLGMKIQTFLIASIVSSALWAGIFLAPGYGIAWMLTN